MNWRAKENQAMIKRSRQQVKRCLGKAKRANVTIVVEEAEEDGVLRCEASRKRA